jgi:hypothetical protein
MQSQRSATAAEPVGNNALVFVPMPPCRVVDTRAASGFTGAYGPPSLSVGIARTFPINSSSTCLFPVTVAAYSLNVTVVPQGPLGFLTIWPTGQARPLASTLNDLQGQIVANAAVVMAGTSGSVDTYASNSTDLVVDINGYYHNATDSLGNTALGWQVLDNNTSGYANTGVGFNPLSGNTTGYQNTAIGRSALAGNTTGCCNTSVGDEANDFSQTGSYNIALGWQAGMNVAGSNNIDIGNAGVNVDNGTIRIGTSGTHTRFIAAGISGVTPGGSLVPVVVNDAGVLGTQPSSRRYKEDIADMNGASDGLLRLRPVVFRYKQAYEDGSKPIDYGLVAEEVAQIYPDLVVRGKDGKIETVQYQKLTPMLLNEVQKEHERGERQAEMIRQQAETIRQQADQIRTHEDRLVTVERLLKSK